MPGAKSLFKKKFTYPTKISDDFFLFSLLHYIYFIGYAKDSDELILLKNHLILFFTHLHNKIYCDD